MQTVNFARFSFRQQVPFRPVQPQTCVGLQNNARPVPRASMRQSCTFVESPRDWLSQDHRIKIAQTQQFGFFVLARRCYSAG